MDRNLTIATCQHAVSGDISKNTLAVIRQMRTAKSHNADIAHFSECNLSGYAGIDFLSYQMENETILQKAFEQIREEAKNIKIWVIIGKHHFEEGYEKPFNSLFLIDNQGEIAGRYDKRLLAGEAGQMDLKYYSPGKDPIIFELNGIKCGFLICHEWRYPELYREYKLLGVDLIFQSWYDGNLTDKQFETDGREDGKLILGTVKGNAANNYLWISGSNTSRKESCFPAFIVQPDGKIYNRLKRNRAGVLISKIDPDKKFVDPSGPNRSRIMQNSVNLK